MADPGFVPGIIGALIAEALKRVIIAAETAYRCKKLCAGLRTVLLRLEPVVQNIIDQPSTTSNASPREKWLQDFLKTLEDAESAIQACSDLRPVDPVARLRLGKRVLKITRRIQDLLSETSLMVLDAVLSPSVQTQEQGSVMKEMHEDLKRTALGITTLTSLMSADRNNVLRAFYNIKTSSDELTIAGSSSGSGSEDAEGSEVLESSRELQPVPKFVFGLDALTESLQELITSGGADADPLYIGVWGKGGGGKTLLAQRAHNTRAVQQHFRDGVVIWLTVGRTPSTKNLYATLCSHLKVPYYDFLSLEDSKTKLLNVMEKKRVLLILDDVWDMYTLQCLDLAKGPGSVTLLTTRNEPVLQSVGGKKVHMNSLSEDDSWCLFCVHAFGGEQNVSPELEALAKLVATECKGLPLALKVIGGAMVGKTSPGQWKIELRKLQDSTAINQDVEVQLFKRLQLSYDDLDTVDCRCKDCFLYFAAFPEDEEVDVEQLVGLWLGEKMLAASGDDPMDEAYCLLGLLIGRSLIELSKGYTLVWGRKFFTLKIHDVLRDLALYIVQQDVPEHRQQFLARPGRQLTEYPRNWIPETGTDSWVLQARRLSLMQNKIETLPDNLHAPYLRTLLLGNNEDLEVPRGFFVGLTSLMVLDLSHSRFRVLPNSIANLKLLVYLNLRSTALTKLPESVSELRKLAWLSLQNCHSLKYLPVGVAKLTSLQYLNLNDCGVLGLWDNTRPAPFPNLRAYLDYLLSLF